MKGAVYIALNDFVEQEYGMAVWEKVLKTVKPASEGIYTSTLDYDDEEMQALLVCLAENLDIEMSILNRVFGRALFLELNNKFPIFTKLSPDLYSFLNSIETVIHSEVRKLYSNPCLPSLICEKLNEKHLKIIYTSPRKLCFLAEGLIYGAADFYGEDITVSQSKCLHRQDKHCELEVYIDE